MTENRIEHVALAPSRMSQEYTHGGMVDKVSRYGWTFKDQPGDQVYLDKNDLHVDKSYQRNATKDKVQRIAREWSWIACNSICVAARDGQYFVVDGQHRVMAARKRSDIHKLPCLVFETAGSVEEAKGFLNANVNRKPMTMQERFNALLMAEDKTALKAEQYVKQSGRFVSRHADGTTFTPIKTLMQCIEQNESALAEVWPLLIEICEGKPFHNELIQGTVYLQSRATDGCSLALKPWRDKMLKAGHNELLDSIYRAKAFYAKGTTRVAAAGILQVVNHGMRKRHFAVDWPS